jgi:hypothetical protein
MLNLFSNILSTLHCSVPGTDVGRLDSLLGHLFDEDAGSLVHLSVCIRCCRSELFLKHCLFLSERKTTSCDNLMDLSLIHVRRRLIETSTTTFIFELISFCSDVAAATSSN